MKRQLLVLCGLFFYTTFLFSQNETDGMLRGLVTNQHEELLVGATLKWVGTNIGTVTDAEGRFLLPRRGNTEAATLVIQYVGYRDQQVEVLPGEDNLWIELTDHAELETVVVKEQGFGSRTSTIGTRNVESIGSKELRKAPCCNLSESFETNGAVDVVYANALTGVKEIQMLGLRGVYSQFMLENRPTMTGIATPFAFEYIPGTWLSGIQLAKGASTVHNGNAGITGQINAELVKPHLDNPLFVNAFTSSEGRGELNVHLNHAAPEDGKLSHGLLLHGSMVQNNWDMNDDNFYDSPNRRQLNALYRTFLESPEWCGQFNVQALTDRRGGGQISLLDPASRLFEIQQNNDRIEAWGKFGRVGLWGKPYNQLGNMISASWHRTTSVFGANLYDATQQSFYWQTLLQTIIGTTDHQVIVAPSVQYDDIRENVNDTNLDRREMMPGVMAEYSYNRPNLELGFPDLVVVLGARADWNNRFGWQFTPRASVKYNFNVNTVVRLSGGRGFRSPNLVAENISLLASNRRLDFARDLSNEAAWNYGVNFTQNWKMDGRPASFSLDLYRTDFDRQIVIDVEREYSAVYFYNLEGRSYSNSLLATLQYNLLPGLETKVAYKFNDVRTTYAGRGLQWMPLVPRHRGLVTLDYTTPNERWMFNTHVQIVGPQRLPDNSQIPHEYRHDFPEVSPTFATWNAQATFRVNSKLEFYAGGENILGYQQHNAIIAANDPWSPYFNGSQIWAPMMGAVGYLGVRYTPRGL